MEYFSYGDLASSLTAPLPEADARAVAHQLVEGITIMHKANIAHRDLKPQVLCSKSLTAEIISDMLTLRMPSSSRNHLAGLSESATLVYPKDFVMTTLRYEPVLSPRRTPLQNYYIMSMRMMMTPPVTAMLSIYGP